MHVKECKICEYWIDNNEEYSVFICNNKRWSYIHKFLNKYNMCPKDITKDSLLYYAGLIN